MARQIAFSVLLLTLTITACQPSDHSAKPSQAPSTVPDEPLTAPLRIIMMPVQSGDCALVIFPNGKTMMIDTGKKPKFTTVVEPFLDRHRVTHLDYFVNSHPHPDHAEGKVVMEASEMIDGRTVIWDWNTFDYEDEFTLEGVNFFVYNTRDTDLYGHDANPNSLAFRMEYNGFVYTTGGDEGLKSMNRFQADHPAHFEGAMERTFLVPGPAPVGAELDPLDLSAARPRHAGYAYRLVGKHIAWSGSAYQRLNGNLRDLLPHTLGVFDHVLVRLEEALVVVVDYSDSDEPIDRSHAIPPGNHQSKGVSMLGGKLLGLPPGGSTLITSVPRSARILPRQLKPPSVRSRTRYGVSAASFVYGLLIA